MSKNNNKTVGGKINHMINIHERFHFSAFTPTIAIQCLCVVIHKTLACYALVTTNNKRASI